MLQKYKKFWKRERKKIENIKKSKKIWNILKIFLSLQRQNVSFDYPGRIPRRQDFIDTAFGARHHDNYSILKAIPHKGWFLSFIDFLKRKEEI